MDHLDDEVNHERQADDEQNVGDRGRSLPESAHRRILEDPRKKIHRVRGSIHAGETVRSADEQHDDKDEQDQTNRTATDQDHAAEYGSE